MTSVGNLYLVFVRFCSYLGFGIKGFEPLNIRTKNERLAAWLYPNFIIYSRIIFVFKGSLAPPVRNAFLTILKSLTPHISNIIEPPFTLAPQ